MSALDFARLGVLIFFAICFLQAGLDKLFDWRGNAEYFQSHFAKSPVRGMVGMMLPVLAGCEILSGALCLGGAATLGLWGNPMLGEWAIVMCILTLLMLFGGQRLAKDYAGASSIAGYFSVALLGMALFTITHI